MAIVTVSNLSLDWGGNTEDVTSLTERDPLYSPTGIQAAINTPMALQAFTPPVGALWLHFRWLSGFSGTNNADGHVLTFYDANEDMLARLDMNNGSMASQLFGDTIVTGDYVVRPSATLQTIDIRLEVTPTTIEMNLYINGGGASVSTAVSANTSGLKTSPARLLLNLNDVGNTSDLNYFSEFIITDGEDTRGWRLATLEPDADGAYDQWFGGTSELGDRDSGTSASVDVGGSRQSWTPTAYAGPVSPSSIRAVVTKSQTVRGAGASPSEITQFLRIGGVDYDGSAQTFTAGERRDIIEVWTDNPSTTLPWTTTELAALEAGLLSGT